MENLTGGSGSDSLIGSVGPNILTGGPGNDTLEGLDGTDALNGGPGNDQLTGHAGADTMSGGPGSDVASYGERESPVHADLDGVKSDHGEPGRRNAGQRHRAPLRRRRR